MQEVKNNQLYIDNVSCEDLRKKFGTPLIVYSKEDIEFQINELRYDFLKFPKSRVAYASKAFLCLEMSRIIKDEGLSLDVVSLGELFTALKAEFPPERIEFNGNNKGPEEIEAIVKYGVGRVIVDGVDEIELLEEECRREGKKIKCLLRVSPGVDSHTHSYIKTGHLDSKFGIPMAKEIFEPVFEKALKSEYVELLGFHFHVGSQLMDGSDHMKALTVVLDLVKELYEKYDFVPTEFNLGGGFGIKYLPTDRPQEFAMFLRPMLSKICKLYMELGEPFPAVVIEPGRSIVGEAGTTLYTVGTVKDIPGVRKYVSVDGGMTDNIRPALYKAEYNAVNASNPEGAEKEKVTICGKACESGDIIIKDIELPKLKRGDLIAVNSTGAYCYSMASNYNMHTRPAVVMIEDGKPKLIIKRESLENLIENQI